ncbi:TlpA disulfide reductase family protein [Aequorivita sp. SDUM287046]|uniref:TlpA disulfide reductase family protein n=1 Tax=Aequorivita aurantiaca TaxID=3053356 RepID=A0ABT8DFZ1_9FLAO|nr:TlpA disulfide reductase family protein [Aequorivita aurantiaca]MDN3724158.1 TlpA disulfide reductase family protein [Aequorivita aurantiaca]
MKNLFLIAIICLFVACKQEQPPRDYAVIHGKITNPIEKIDLRLYDPVSSESVILKVDENGTFRDTLKLKEPAYYTAVYNNVFNLYIANNMDIEINFDGNKISETIAYSGKGSEENNFLRYKTKKSSELMGEDYKEYLGLENNAFDTKTSAYTKDLIQKLDDKNVALDTAFIASEKESIAQFEKDIQAQHEQQLQINAALGAGMPSPQFTDYVNYKGGKSSLADFKGKYVYIDVWATWCVPCVYEMPYMNQIEKEYEGKNIHFVGISIDRKKDEEKWRKMIVEKELHGTQLLADNEIDSKFIQDYFIQGIPRFILLDPQGNIVSYDAPRPSEPRLKELFSSLNI